MNGHILKKIYKEKEDILRKKGHDYSSNIGGMQIDNLKIAGLPGIAVRILDKATRAVALTHGKTPKVTDEALRDTLLDVSNYGDLGVMFVDGTYDSFRPCDKEHDDPGEPDGEEDEEEKEEIICFHSRNMYRAAIEGLIPSMNEKPVSFVNTADFTFNGARTPLSTFEKVRDIVINSKHVHVVWDGNDLFIPMIVGMAMAWGIPVSSGRVDFPQGHPSRVHTLINSLPPVEA